MAVLSYSSPAFGEGTIHNQIGIFRISTVNDIIRIKRRYDNYSILSAQKVNIM